MRPCPGLVLSDVKESCGPGRLALLMAQSREGEGNTGLRRLFKVRSASVVSI